MTTFAETLSDTERSRYRFYATSSACFGSVATVMLADSAIIIVFASMLGLSDSVSMMTTALSYIAYTFLMLPAAYIAERFTYQKTICVAVAVSAVMFMLLAAVPFFPSSWHGFLVMASCGAYALTLPFYVAGWFPMLDTILLKSERGAYFSRMRVAWQICSMGYIFLSGAIMGAHPPLYLLQLIIVFSGLSAFGRMIFISKIPVPPPALRPSAPPFRVALEMSLRNSALGGFSVYLFCLFALSSAMCPLAYTYLKQLDVSKNYIVMISALAMAGTMLGYGFGSTIVRRIGAKKMVMFCHGVYIFLNLTLFFCSSASYMVLIAFCLTVYGFTAGALSILISMEMLALARPRNKAMAMAFCGTFQYAGTGSARFLSSLAIGCGVLSPSWTLFGIHVSQYQSLFLMNALGLVLISLLLVVVPAVVPKHDDYYQPV